MRFHIHRWFQTTVRMRRCKTCGIQQMRTQTGWEYRR
jgi:hypothetical protein